MVVPSGLPVPPLSPYGTLTGDLFLYAAGRAAFESPSLSSPSPKKCILLGGLSDGLMPVPYTAALEQCCVEHGFSLVQPILSSSYTGFGHGSLDRDCQELVQLLDYLETHRSGKADATGDSSQKEKAQECQYCLVGHSTGCQDIVHFLKVAPEAMRQRVKGVVLQASVSDREDAQMKPEEYNKHLALARSLCQNEQPDECMPRSAFWAPITAQRFMDLHERGGRDDYFSSDYTDAELQERLGHVLAADGGDSRHVLVAFSGADEYVPPHVDAQVLTNRLVQAMNAGAAADSGQESREAVGVSIPKANHNLSQPPVAAVEVFMEHVAKLFEKIA